MKLKGFKVKEYKPYHFQVRHDGFIFNIYPTTQTLYINGAFKGIKYDSLEHLTRIIKRKVNLPAVGKGKRVKRESSYKQDKKKLYVKCKICAICKVSFKNIKEATLDHKIPLMRGGSNQFDNMQLTHEKCNSKKGNNFKK